jgi:3-hydroxybutyryl-CoA dehydrogenase
MHGVQRVGVIGSGQMGGGIAQVAAQSGFDTVVYDLNSGALEKCKALHDKLFARAVEKGKMTAEDVKSTKGRLVYTDRLGEVQTADIVIEAVVERAEVKKDIFRGLVGSMGKNAILASNITDLATSVGPGGGPLHRHALLQPGAGDEAGRGDQGLATSKATTER